MDRPIFLTNNYSRKPEFQLQTQAVKNNRGTIYFQKKALHPAAKQHLLRLTETDDILKSQGLSHLFCRSKLKHDVVQFEYVDGESFEGTLLNATITNNHKALAKMLDLYDDFLEKMTESNSKPIHNHDYDKVFFGPRLYDKFKSSPCLYPGVLDLNFDNLLVNNDRLIAIDYEWSFSHCLPVNYVVARTILWFGIRYAAILKMHSEHIPVYALSDEVVLPEIFVKRYAHLLDDIKLSYLMEWRYFQPAVNSSVNKQCVDFYKNPVRYEQKSLFAIDHLELQKEAIDNLNRERSRLSEEINIRDSEVRRLTQILNRRRYKAITRAFNAGSKVKRSIKKRRLT